MSLVLVGLSALGLVGPFLFGGLERFVKSGRFAAVGLDEGIGILLVGKGPLGHGGHDAPLGTADDPGRTLGIDQFPAVVISYLECFDALALVFRHVGYDAIQAAGADAAAVTVAD